MKFLCASICLCVTFVLGGVAYAETPLREKSKVGKKRRGPVESGRERLRARRAIDKGETEGGFVKNSGQARVKQMRVLMSGCAVKGTGALRSKLKSLSNPGQLMSLEVWGDSKRYVPGQKVYFFFRSPRASYVTLFWLGPKSDIVVPLRNVPIPANQDVRIDSGGIIVPPLGREEWVAINTLEPLHFPCFLGEGAVLRRLRALERLPYGVGHWVVNSRP